MLTSPDNKSIYDEKWDEWFDQKVYGPASRWLRWLIERNVQYADVASISRVIDVGCGQGATTAMLAQLLPNATVVGIDFSATGIAAATQHYGNARLKFVADESSLLLNTSQYDLVTCYEVLEHVDDWEPLLARICKASNKYVMLSFPVGRMRPYEVVVGHVRNFQRGQVEAFMERQGFVGRNVFYAGFPFYSPLYREFCNLMDAGNSNFASGRYGLPQKIVGGSLYLMFRYLSLTRKGDQFCGLFERR